MHVSPYSYSRMELDPVRKRKLLLHRKEIVEIERGTASRAHARSVARLLQGRPGKGRARRSPTGKHDYDKRQALAERDAKRETERAMKGIRE